MGRKSKKEVVYNNDCCVEDPVIEQKVEAPDVQVTLSEKKIDKKDDVEKQDIPKEKNEVEKIVDECKKQLFEHSKQKVKVIQKVIKKEPEVKKIKSISVNLVNKPIMSRYKGTKTRKISGKSTLTFKIGGKY